MNDIKQSIKEIDEENPNLKQKIKRDLSFQVSREVVNARTEKGMTQAEVAEKMNTRQPAIARVESGANIPSLSFLETMAKEAFDSYLLPPRFAFMHNKNIISYKGENDKSFKDYSRNQSKMDGSYTGWKMKFESQSQNHYLEIS